MTLNEYKRQRGTPTFCEHLTILESNLNSPSENEKRELITCLLDDLEKQEWDQKTCLKALSILKILGRNTAGADPLFTEKSMQVLTKLAGLQADKMIDTPVSREALKCIVNSIHLKPHLKNHFDSYIHSLLSLLCGDIVQETQFLVCRALFLLTVYRDDLVTYLINGGVAKGIEKVLQENVSILKSEKKQTTEPIPVINPSSTMSEALKLLFNVMLVGSRNENGDNKSAEFFKGCLIPIFYILFEIPLADPQPMIPPHSQAVHALMQFPGETIASAWKSQKEWLSQTCNTPEKEYNLISNIFITLLNKSIHALIPSGDPDCDALTDSQQTDAILSPLLLVIRNLSEKNPALRDKMSKHMLPSEKDRLRPVNQGNSLPALLIRLMTSTMLPQTQSAICEAYFVLCGKDANNFTKQVGYGNAIGYLVNKGIPVEIPENDNGTLENINPITGQYLPAEDPGPSLADMTDEEKEREAERLFVLFERLKKTGVVDVENPIAKAMREGKLESTKQDNSDSD